jgi:hypothetical protein
VRETSVIGKIGGVFFTLFCFKEEQKEFMSKSNFLFQAGVFPFGLILIPISALFIRLIIRFFQLVFSAETVFFSKKIGRNSISAGLSAQRPLHLAVWRWGRADAVWAFGGAHRRGASEHARPLWTNSSDLGASD